MKRPVGVGRLVVGVTYVIWVAEKKLNVFLIKRVVSRQFFFFSNLVVFNTFVLQAELNLEY